MAGKKNDWRDNTKLTPQTVAQYKRLEKTPQGLALLELLELCGGPTALARALDANVRTINTWCHRGQIGQQGAYLLEETPFFADKGWTKEKARPDIKEMQWPGRRHDFGGFLGMTDAEIAISQERHAKRLEERASSKLEKEIESNKEFLARVNGAQE